MTTTPTRPPTAEELALARKIADSGPYMSGSYSWHVRNVAALAAIRETTERAAKWLQSEANELFRDDADKAGEELQQAAQCLHNNEHLKDSGHD